MMDFKWMRFKNSFKHKTPNIVKRMKKEYSEIKIEARRIKT
tara:strand:+ start:106 stop:228 length:123 start_codon:yes stop_codon:yes gene_type:complete